MSKKVENTIMNNPEDFFGGYKNGWGSYHNPESIGYKFEEKSGLRSGGSIGWGNGVSIEFGLSGGLTLVLQLQKKYGKIWIDALSKYPCNGLPLENWVDKVIETVKVADNDKEVEKGILQVARAVKKVKRKVVKELGKKAKISSDAKSMWMQTI